MDAKELDRYKQLLLAKQLEVLAARNGSVGLAAGGPHGDLMDQATQETEAKLQLRLRLTEGHLLRAIEEALGRIVHGTFGVCETCRHPISRVRLEAVPWTRHCRDCKEQRHLAA
jgi:RNA polymerase-binding transcription factor